VTIIYFGGSVIFGAVTFRLRLSSIGEMTIFAFFQRAAPYIHKRLHGFYDAMIHPKAK
jgi:hypothetical protein